jgi:hypothetical protein
MAASLTTRPSRSDWWPWLSSQSWFKPNEQLADQYPQAVERLLETREDRREFFFRMLKRAQGPSAGYPALARLVSAVVREGDDLQPHRVVSELLKRELGQAGVLIVTDAVLDVRVLTMTALQHADLRIGLIGQDRLEAIPVLVGEAQLRARVRSLTADD